MMMLLKKTNIHEKLITKRSNSGTISDQLETVRLLLAKEEDKRIVIRKKLYSKSEKNFNAFEFDLLKTERIFHIKQIKETCIEYRLRFLDSHLYKVPFPEEVITQIKYLEKQHQIQLEGFKLMAPSKVFQLKRYDDPILFAPIGNDYYYLIHKWGNDLHPLRKWLVLPFRNLPNLLLFFMVVSFICSALLPDKFYGIEMNGTMKFVSFLFIFKYWCAVGLYYGVSHGKNFNINIWNSNFGG
ncbi:hypothetical protein LZZ90_07910 [Flavobacterium sp. SM15]|uniref:hypothetical protein n=1 Tax=Flavobacterium sp. SM15 TaxID=2908005 RepID=UPI001EDBE8EB|nr:hypothetical protein [Flavobacterium sp. SM15]MCG2611429.1 hypothetical protein [Flavobacterium sp. SM15]